MSTWRCMHTYTLEATWLANYGAYFTVLLTVTVLYLPPYPLGFRSCRELVRNGPKGPHYSQCVLTAPTTANAY